MLPNKKDQETEEEITTQKTTEKKTFYDHCAHSMVFKVSAIQRSFNSKQRVMLFCCSRRYLFIKTMLNGCSFHVLCCAAVFWYKYTLTKLSPSSPSTRLLLTITEQSNSCIVQWKQKEKWCWLDKTADRKKFRRNVLIWKNGQFNRIQASLNTNLAQPKAVYLTDMENF